MRIVDAERFAFDTHAGLRTVAFSPDARRVVTLNVDNRVQLWDSINGELRAAFQLPEGAREAGHFSADGSKLLYRVDSGDDHRILVFDTASGERLADVQTFEHAFWAHTPFDPRGTRFVFVQPDGRIGVYDFAQGRVTRTIAGRYVLGGYSRDGRFIVSGDAQGLVHLLDAGDGRPLRSFESLGSPVVYTDFTPDGSLLAAGAARGAFRVWEVATGKTRIRSAHSSRYVGHVFNAIDGSRLLTASVDSARVWDTRSGALLSSLNFTDNDQPIHISENGRWLVNTGTARLSVTDILSGAAIFSLDRHFGGIAAVDFSRDGKSLVSAGRDGVVAIWRLPEFPLLEFGYPVGFEDPSNPLSPELPVVGIFSPGGHFALTAGGEGRATLRDAKTLAPVAAFEEEGQRTLTAAAFSRDDSLLALGSAGRVSVWNTSDGRFSTAFGGFTNRVTLLRFSPDGKRLAASIRGGVTKLWDLGDGRQLASFDRDYSPAMAFSPDGRNLGIGIRGVMQSYDILRGAFTWTTPLGEPGEEIAAVDFSRDGARVLAVTSHGGLFLLDAAGGGRVQSAHNDTSTDVIDAHLSRDGRSALVADSNRCAVLWRITEGTLKQLCDHANSVRSVDFSPDGSLILTGSSDGTAKVWESATGDLLDTVAYHSGALAFYNAGFDSTGRRVITGSRDGTAAVWELSPEMRDAAAIARILRCRAPWTLDGDTLVPARSPEPAACR